MKHRVTLLVLAALSLALPARADVLDQSFTGGPGQVGTVNASAIFKRAQTFAVGRTGTLSRIFLSLAQNGDPDEDLVIDIRPTDENGTPELSNLTVLGSVFVLASELGGTHDFENLFELDFTGEAIAVTAGEKLAIVLSSALPSTGPAYSIGALIGGTYAGGDAWVSTGGWSLQDGGGVDLVFETWVEVPEPAGAATAAVLALVALRRRRSS